MVAENNKRLTLLPAVRGNAHDVLVKAHVKHPVCLIEDQDFQRRQVNVTQRQMGQHAPWRDNDDVRTFGQGFLFLRKFFARASPIDGEGRDAGVVGKALGCLVDLDGQFTGWEPRSRL